MKKTFLLVIIVSFFSANSQTVEEKIATKTCICLQKISNSTEKQYSECLATSLAEVIADEKDAKIRETINTVEGITGMLQKSDELVAKNCPTLNPKKAVKKSEAFYASSKNESAQSKYNLAKDLMRDKKYKLAIDGFQLSLKEDPNFVLALDDIAVCYRQLNDYDNAIKYYKKSLSVFPEGDYALMNIGVVYTLKSDFKTAIEYYEKLIKYQPDNAEGYFGVGKNYLALNEDEKALDQIFKAHRIYTSDKSEYVKDTETLMGAIYQKMKKENKEEAFKRIAAENNINIE